MDDQAVRLNRIEAKLDKLTEAMSMIARVDEKLVAGAARIDRLEYRLDEQESEIDTLKSDVLGWVWAVVDQSATEAALTADIEAQKNPTTADGMPW